MPVFDILECLGFGDIKDMDNTVSVFEIGGYETTISLLTGRIPHLKTIYLAIFIEILDVEIDANSILI